MAQTRDDAKRVIQRNIRTTVRRWRNDGTTGASIGCLFGCVPTDGLTIPLTPAGYAVLFEEVARETRVPGFSIYEDGANV